MKKLFISFFLLLGCFFAWETISAYMSDKDEQTNSFTIGINEIEIIEDYEPVADPQPGDRIRKEVTVKNIGTVSCYVRIFAQCSNGMISDYLTFDFDTQHWTAKQSDGYYYYKYVLAPNEITTPLFTMALLSTDMPENMLKDFDIIIYAESIQSEGFEDAAAAFASIQ